MYTKTPAKIVLLLLSLALLQSLLYLPAQAAPSGQRLRALTGSFMIGYAAASNFNNRSDSATYQSVASSEFNFVTPENAMKWDATEPNQGSFSFGTADAIVSFAQANSQRIHGHTLVWHSQLPGWVNNISGAANMTTVMNNHIDGVMNHWPDGTIYAWDVVNEAFNEDGSRRSSPFQNQIGNGYIEAAFRRARTADGQTKLIYNDYNVETVNSKSTAMYNMVSDFKARGVPIDGVGLQMHLTSGGLDYNSLASNMARFAALGVDIYITEMDVRLTTPASQTDLNNQATIYRNVLDKCLLQPRCVGLQVWGIPDKDSWVMSTFPGTGSALIFDDNYNAKPAYFSMQTRLGGGGVTNTPTRTNTPVLTNTPTRTPTRTVTPVITLTRTPTNTACPAVTGDVRLGSSTGPGIAGVQLTGVSTGSPTITGTSDASGHFVLGGCGRFNMTVTPQLTGYTFAPAQQAFTSAPLLFVGTANGTLTSTPTRTPTGVSTACDTPGACTPTVTRTPTRTPTPVTPTATPGTGTCAPVNATITAPFTFDGAGTFCWQSSNLGSFINNWNLASLTINGVNFTGQYVPASAYPAKINGFWYVSYTGNFPWSHFEAK